MTSSQTVRTRIGGNDYLVDEAFLRAPALPVGVDQPGTLRDYVANWGSEALDAILSSVSPGLSLEENDPYLEPKLRWTVVRASTRVSPFALAASVSVLPIGGSDPVRLAPVSDARRHSSLSAEQIGSIVRFVAHHHVMQCRFVVNGTLVLRGQTARYVSRTPHVTGSELTLVEVRLPEAITGMLRGLKGGVVSGAQVVEELEATGRALADRLSFLRDLVENDILVPTLQAHCLKTAAIEGLIHELRATGCSSVAEVLERIKELLWAEDQKPLADLASAASVLDDSLREVGGSVARAVEVRLSRPIIGGSLSTSAVRSILLGVDALRRMARTTVVDSSLQEFTERFADRYKTAWVPLVDVMDSEFGLQLEAANGMGSSGGSLSWHSSDEVRAELVARASLAESVDVAIEPEELPVTDRHLPPVFCVVGVICEASEESAVLTYVKECYVPSAAGLLARFADDIPAVKVMMTRNACHEMKFEEHQIAEVIHCPDLVHGDVLRRPSIYEAVVDLDCPAPRSDGKVIAARDLLIGIEHGALALRHACSSERIIPRIAVAHNYMNPRLAGMYRLLGAMQTTGNVGELKWDWGPFRNSSVLPRVRYGKALLAPRRWRLRGAELKALCRATDQQFLDIAQGRMGIPNWVEMSSDDRETTTWHLRDLGHVRELKRRLATVRAPCIMEVMPSAAIRSWVSSDEGEFQHDLVIPVRVVGAKPRRSTPSPTLGPLRRPRAALPGGKLGFIKVYAPPLYSDRLLRESLGPYLMQASSYGTIASWWFVRFADPEWHLRLRVVCRSKHQTEKVLEGMRSLVASETGTRVQSLVLDTHFFEDQKYGGRLGTAIAQGWSSVDSGAVIGALSAQGLNEERCAIGLVGVHRLLEDWCVAPADQLALMKRLGKAALELRGMPSDARRAIGTQFRQKRGEIEHLLTSTPRVLDAVFRDRSDRGLKYVARARASGQGSIRASEFPQHLVHLHMNRVSPGLSVGLEARVYGWLERYYRGVLAREDVTE